MRSTALLIMLFALLAASCGEPPESVGAAEDVISTSVDPVASTAVATESTLAQPSSTTTTTVAVVAELGSDAPAVELLPPSVPGEIVTPGTVYFSFAEASGAAGYTGTRTTMFVTSEGTGKNVAQVLVEGTNLYMRMVADGQASEAILANSGNDGFWIREDGQWEPVTDPLMGIGDFMGAMPLAGPDRVYGSMYRVFDQLVFVGWEQDDKGVAVAHYSGELAAAIALIDVGDVVGETTDGGVDVWLDPRGFFTRYSLVIELGEGTYTDEWQLSNLDATSVELPG